METDRRVYLFHGTRIACWCGPAVAAALDTRLGAFPRSTADGYDLLFEYRSLASGGPELEPPAGPTRSIYDSPLGEVLYSDAADRIWIGISDRVRVACDPRSGHTRISTADQAGEDLWFVTHPLFTLPLTEVLKRRGLYRVHAAGVALGGRAVLFPGTSGAGKSTLSLALAKEGFDFLGDDMLFLARREQGLRALAFPEAIDLTDSTIRLFPELGDLLDQERPPGWPKRQLRVERRFGAEVAWDCQPVALVFPRVGGGRHSVFKPMDRVAALLELAPNILLTEAVSSQAHLDALGALVASCDCYRLETGSDFSELAARLREIVQGPTGPSP